MPVILRLAWTWIPNLGLKRKHTDLFLLLEFCLGTCLWMILLLIFLPSSLMSLPLQSPLLLSITDYSISMGMIYFPLATKELNFLFNFN